MIRLLLPAILLMPTLAAAARYGPDADRAALRQAATICNSTVVDATGLPLMPDNVPAITAGLDEGLRLARLADAAARSLDAAANRRAAEMGAGTSPHDRTIKELMQPIAAERLRGENLSAELAKLRQTVEELPDEDRAKLRFLVAKADGRLESAADALRPAEESVKIMGERALDMKAARREGLRPLVELSTAAAAVIDRTVDLPGAMAEAKERMSALGSEPRGAARTRAWEKLVILRGITRSLFEAADRACNRADDFRRFSGIYDTASAAFEKARPAASPAAAKLLLDEAQRLLAQIRERLKKPA